MKRLIFLMLALLILPCIVMAGIDSKIFEGLNVRCIGPANMSGRIGAIDAVQSDPNIIYVGAATGGVWKSTDGGVTWKPIFDEQPVASIGAIAINQSNPNIVWVGTGEGAVRNSAGVGRGVYLTIDGGKSWSLLGLEKTERICKIILDPYNPNVAYVGAMGTAWGENPERGVYKTTDMGKTWEKILYVDEKTGVADMAMDPSNPNKIIVAMWQYRRWPWFFKSGGPGSGLYLTTNGGKEWKKLTTKEGMPEGELGRIGIAFSTNMPNIVYALVEAKKNVLLRSTNGGYNWYVVNKKSEVSNRPFYYQRIWVNPVNENILYMLHSRMMVSEDGGKSFRGLAAFDQAHSDFHAMWIHPNGEMLIVGNDGGVVISYDRGESWRFAENLPLGQFYHISYDMQIPYNVYGGLQDNGSWRGPAYQLKERAIYSYHWINVGGGDGFDTEPDPENPNCGYGMSQGGNLYYFDISTGMSRYIVPTESDVKHRYNWNAGFAIDPFHPATIYLGSQFVHKSTDKGQTWEIISPDLTTNDTTKQKQAESGGLTLDVTNAENHCSIMCIAPSPLKEGVIWVGTDDGNVQLTTDGGKSWKLVSKKLTTGGRGKVPPATWVSHVEASRFDPATAYVTFDDHRRSNWTPYVYVTHDYGKSWKSLVTPQIDGFAHVIKEDVVDRNLLFLGTEFGLYVSLNGGRDWLKWSHDIPTVAVRDIAVHPRENDLIIGTHGRSIYIVDDISPLREISEEIVQKKLYLFKPPEAIEFIRGRMSSYMSPGDTPFRGRNKQMGACITYYLTPSKKKAQKKSEGETQMMERMMQMGAGTRFAGMTMMNRRSQRVSIDILDSDGKVIYHMNGTEKKGINRVYWSFREEVRDETKEKEKKESARQSASSARSFRSRGMSTITALPGQYTVRIKYEGEEATQPLTVKSDPRLKIDFAVLKKNYEMGKRAIKLSQRMSSASTRIDETKKAIKTLIEFIKSQHSPENKKLLGAAKKIDKKLKEFSEKLSPTPPKQGIADRSAGLRSQTSRAVMMITRAGIYPITQAMLVKYEKVKKKVDDFMKELNQFYATDVENFNKSLKESDFSFLKTYKPLQP